MINVDAPQGGAARTPKTPARRRWLRVLGVLALLAVVLVVVVAVAGFFWWRHYQTTPVYSLAVLVDAAQRNDAEAMQKLIDDDEITKNMFATVNEKAAARYGQAMNSSMQAQIDSLVPTLLPRLKQTIHDEVVKEIQALAARSERRSFTFLLTSVRSMFDIITEDDTAEVKALNEGGFEFTMRQNAGVWKITEFKDEVVVQRVVDSIMKDLPAIGSPEPKPAKRVRRSRSRRRR